MNIFVIFLVLISFAYAAPVGNGAFPALIQIGLFDKNATSNLRLGYEGDFVTDGRMKQKGQRRVNKYEQWTNSATATLNFWQRFDVYTVLGSSKTEAHWCFLSGEEIFSMKLHTKPRFLWGFGARAILYEWCSLYLGAGGRYSKTKCGSIAATQNGLETPLSDFSWREWQVNLDLSYTIYYFTPYLGVKHSKAITRFTDFAGPEEFITRLPIGVYLGCTISNGSYAMLNLEARLLDEEAVTVSADVRF